MADITLSDGRALTFDLYKLTIKEYRSLFDKTQAQDEEDRLIARTVGLSLDEYQALAYPDFRRLADAFFKKAREPLADPNSASASS
jgi:hypothetical protein